MVWKLVEDTVWRMWSLFLLASLTLGLVWMTGGSDGGISTATVLAGSMACAFIGGPFLGLAVSSYREFIYLPMSRRQLWRARATLALIVPVILMLAAKLLGLATAWWLPTGGTLRLRTALLSSVCDFAYIGAGFGLLTRSGLGLRRPRGVFARSRLDSGLWIASALMFMTGPAWPLLFAASLPTEWSELSSGGWLLLVAGMGTGVAVFFHSPELSHSGRAQWGGASGHEASITPETSNALIGMARLIWSGIALSLGCVVLLAVIFRFAGLLSGDRSDTAIFFAVLLVSLSAPTQPETMGVRAALRTLRALPLSTWTMSAVLAAQPLITWFFVWILLVAARLLVGPQLPTLTTGMMCWLVGMASLATAAGLRLTGSPVLRRFPLLLLILGCFAVIAARAQVALPVDLPAPFVALAAVPAAVWLNVQTLTRNHSVYRPLKLPSMFASQGPSA